MGDGGGQRRNGHGGDDGREDAPAGSWESYEGLLDSVSALGLPVPTPVALPAHRRRRSEFEDHARAVAAGVVEIPPELLTGRLRRLHIRDTVIEDHLLRMRLVPAAVASKFDDLSRDPFTFFRGTALLYYRDIAGSDAHLPFVPTVGDVHPENFGVLPGADGAPLFSVNDLDEAWMAPFTWDLGRGAVGFALAALDAGASRAKARKVAKKFVEAYLDGIEACREDPDEALRRVTGKGPKAIRAYMAKARRTRESFLAKRIDLDTLTFLEDERVRRRPELMDTLDAAVHEYSRRVVHPDAAEMPASFFDVLDVAVRTGSGTASRGLARFWVLVRGWGESPAEKVIIELKMSRTSVLDGLAPFAEDVGGGARSAVAALDLDPAERIYRAFDAFIADGDPLYGYVDLAGVSFLVRERSPQKVNVDIEDFDVPGLKKYAKLCGRVLARQHVRADGELNGEEASAAERIATAGSAHVFLVDALEFVDEKVDQVTTDFALFAEDFARGAFDSVEF